MTEAYPLAWPPGWPATPDAEKTDGRYHFRRPTSNGRASPFWTFADARDALYDAVRLLGGQEPVVSSNFRTDRYGIPVEGSRRPANQGVAIYFIIDGDAKTMACDRYTRFEENCRSLTLALEAMRTLGRHGGGVMMSKAFAGFTALPPPRTWWEILDVPRSATAEEIEAAYKRKARVAHPDLGGSTALMAELNRAREEGQHENTKRRA